MTLFAPGQIVVATAFAQALVAGARYRVVSVDERVTPFGTFVTYTVTPVEPLVRDGIVMAPDRFLIPVTNGHILLQAEPTGITVNGRAASLVDVARLAAATPKPWLCPCGQLNRGKDRRCTKRGCDRARPEAV